MKKTLSVLLLVITLLSCLNLNAFAAIPETVQPRWINTFSTSENFVFDGTTGIAGVRVNGKPGTNKIEGYGAIYKHVGNDWEFVTDASKTSYGISCYIEIEFQGEIGYEYKAEYTYVVYKGGVGETVQSTLYETCD